MMISPLIIIGKKETQIGPSEELPPRPMRSGSGAMAPRPFDDLI